ncbi:hypothetical protein FNF28_03593 [Cafeteria roenbergensis]|uniref:Rad50/SbcC-type AAA domain-containing protein n=1 Tax=Cafeteria roenbergensis TaxID=33653 RepID=A0A5A8DIM4_CAFRO|nr:hypothetical protein FNF28_03593 [Cafeteria roenbergensis]
MAFIKLLSVQGIRAFDPLEEALIKFDKPLTVIVGENGCGKTTIIECLKYITTGQAPPNTSRGREFVHDPSILALSDVKAQIKLRFCDEAGRNHVAIRSFQLSAGSGRSRKATLKTLDGVLVRSERAADGTMEKVTTQMRASALDEVLPQLLGLPRPILEHVVFCHQEDSTWPLQEGAALKQRFDDIFATTRYSKAMEEVKKRRKALHDDAVTSQGDLQRLRTLADEARRLGRENAATDAQIARIEGRRSAATARVEACDARLQQLQGAVAEEAAAREEKARLKQRAADCEAEAGRLRAQLVEDYASDPDAAAMADGATVQAALDAAQRQLDDARASAADMEELRDALQDDLRAGDASVAAERERRARLQGRVMAVLEAASEHAAAVRAFCTEHGVAPPELPAVDSEPPLRSGDTAASHASSAQAAPASSASAGGRGVSASRGASAGPGGPSSRALLERARRFHAGSAAREAAIAAFARAVSSRVAGAEEAALQQRKRLEGEEAELQRHADDAHARSARREAAARSAAASRRAAEDEAGEARAALAELGLDAKAAADRALAEQRAKVDHLVRRTEREAGAARGGGAEASARQAVAALDATVSRLRRWLKAARARVEAARGEQQRVAQAQAARARAEAARREARGGVASLRKRAEALPGDCADDVIAGAALDDPAGAAAAVAEAVERTRTASARLEAEAERARGRAEEARARADGLRHCCSALEASMAEAKAVLSEGGGGGPGALSAHGEAAARGGDADDEGSQWDAASGRPAPVEDLEEMLEAARNASRRAAADGDRAGAAKETLSELEELAVRKCACPLCGQGVDAADADAMALLRRTVRQTMRKLAGRFGGASEDECDAAERRAERLARQVAAARRWHADADKLADAVASREAACEDEEAAAEEAAAAAAALQRARERLGALNDLRPAAAALEQQCRAAQAADKEADQLEGEAAALGGGGGVLSLGPAEASADALDKEAATAQGGGGGGGGDDGDDDGALEEDERVIRSAARAPAGGSAAADAVSALEVRLQLREEDRERARAALAEQQARAAALRGQVAEARAEQARLEGRVAEAERRQTRVRAAEAAISKAEAAAAAAEREASDVAAALRKAGSALEAGRADKRSRTAEAEAACERLRRAAGRVGEARARLERAGREDPSEALTQAEDRLEAAGKAAGSARRQLEDLAPRLEAAKEQLAQAEKVKGEARLLVAYQGLRSRRAELKGQLDKARLRLRELGRAVAEGRVGGGAAGAASRSREEQEREEQEYWGDEDLAEDDAAAAGGVEEAEADARREAKEASAAPSRKRARAARSRTMEEGDDDDDDDEEEEEEEEEGSAAAPETRDRGATQEPPARQFQRPAELEGVEARIERLQARLRLLRDVAASCGGQLKSLLQAREAREARLASGELEGIEERLARESINETTLKMAVADLDVFYRGLDRALMRYHELMIEDVNKSIRDLWNMTYQGRDIDCIQIRSDASDVAAGAAAGKRRSYNYRVVMSKGGTELAMRGRCSAGQKMLACLIIRLALQQAFAATKCGVLALDEPTTNLDEENKRGLAQAIAMILQSRAAQSHFQLIIITHDTDFVNELNEAMQTLGTGDCRPEHVFRVSRREHPGFRGKFVSSITRHEWGTMMR